MIGAGDADTGVHIADLCSCHVGAELGRHVPAYADQGIVRRACLSERLSRLPEKERGTSMSDTIARVRDYMVTDLVTLSPETEIIRAITTLLDAGVSGACVLDDEGNLVGILSKRDGLNAALSAAYYKEWGGTVADLMSTELEVFDANLDLVSAAERFVKSAFRRFPVVEEGRLLGQVSRTDVLRALSLQWR